VSPSPLDELVSLLDLERIEDNIFRGFTPDSDENRERVFGGQVAAQALMAAGRCAPADRPVHSLHSYFLRPGDPTVPILYTVERIRDGKSFNTRRVVAVQHGEAIFLMSAQFHRSEEGPSHGLAMPDAPAADTLPTQQERVQKMIAAGIEVPPWASRPNPIDLRYVGEEDWDHKAAPRKDASKQVWARGNGELDADPLLHACVITYLSDMTLLPSVMIPWGLTWEGVAMMASLDHAMWFHRPCRADRWLLFDQESPASGGSRGLVSGRLYTEDGDLAVSIMQEGVVRVTPQWWEAHKPEGS
jgi:acyl-CoA thioesterase II